jgi:hypothetical protein
MTEEIDDDLTIADVEKATQFKDSLNYQIIIGKQINRIAIYRDVNIKQYASAIDTLIIMLDPDEIYPMVKAKREKLNLDPCNYDGMNIEKQKKYDDLWVFIHKQLKDHGLIFRTSNYDRGTL